MALFGTKKNPSSAEASEGKEETPEASTKAVAVSAPTTSRGLTHVLKSPRITEKATMHSEAGVYLFDVSERATKRDIMQAVRALYKVTPRKVRVAYVPSKVKRNMRTGKSGIKKGGKKAYVYLKKGEIITLA